MSRGPCGELTNYVGEWRINIQPNDDGLMENNKIAVVLAQFSIQSDETGVVLAQIS